MPLWQTTSKNNERQDIFKEYIHVTKTLYLLTLIITNTNLVYSFNNLPSHLSYLLEAVGVWLTPLH